ncbi:oocyte zinc finger protein XlCOF6-like isoform X2 [Periplaneta americana]|uniref:oocyte zinc finger protein XlCOF6-like isoform X2 n=1 Tax=Periplaneta americana TaxID=6978 RepID=UPI0037E7F5BC
MTYCCVPFCTSNRKKSGGRLSFHEFPCDRERCEKWLKVISRQDFVPNSNSPSSVVCSLHFKEEDYCNNGKFRRLKPNVVPTIFPNYSKYKVTGIKRPRRTITKTDLPPAKKRKSSSDVGFSVFKQDVPSSSAPVNDVFFLPVKSDHKDTQTDSVQRSEVSKSAVIRAMDEIKMEPEIDPLSIETSDNTDLEEKKPFLEEGKSFDLHLNRIKEECLDQSSDFNSEINFEDIAMPNNVSVVKCETEEGNLQDMGLNAEAIDHSCLTSEIKVEEVAVPYFFEVKCEPQEKSHDLDTVKDDLTLDVMPLEDTVITDRSPIDRDKSVSSVSIDIPCEDRPTGCQGQDSFVSSGRIAGESFIECRDYETVFVSQNSLKSQPSSYSSFRSETLRNSNKCDICGKMLAISTALKYQLQLDLSENALKCDTCEISFPESTKSREHTRFLKNEKPFTCDVCEKNCSDSKALKRHMLKHTGEKSFKCSVCEKFFLTSGQLKMHVRKHTGEKPFKCDICGKCFSQSGSLKTHTRQHTGDKPFKCDECGMCFSNSTNLKTHARAHSGERPFKCLDCGKCFTQSGNLKIHARQHTGEKPFKCNICGKFFSYSETLQRHQSVHTSEKPFKCDVCGSFFSKLTNLKRHVRMHTGEKTFKCQDCEKCFWDLRRLKIHVRQHTGERPYMCDICGKRFLESGTLKTHARKHTGDKPFKCRDCGKCYRESGHLKVHTRVHTGEKPFKCNVCGKCFSHSGILKVHERKHTGEKSFKCPVCGKCFWESSHLKMHSRMHTGEKPFKCHICGKCFSQSGNLKVHVRQHNDEK